MNIAKIVFIMLILSLYSCALSIEEKLIENHINTNDNETRVQSLDIIFLQDITSKDSLDYLVKYFNKKRADKIKQLEKTMQDLSEELKKATENKSTDKNEQDNVETYYRNMIKESKNYIQAYKSDCKGTFLEKTYLKINALKSNTDSVLTKKYLVKYVVVDPQDEVEIEVKENTFFLNSDRTNILLVE